MASAIILYWFVLFFSFLRQDHALAQAGVELLAQMILSPVSAYQVAGTTSMCYHVWLYVGS